MISHAINALARRVWQDGIALCENKAKEIIDRHKRWSHRPLMLLNVGSGSRGAQFSECENRAVDASASGIDFNTWRLPLPDRSCDIVLCEQVIEHLHNTTHFLSELHRVAFTGGTVIISTENLASLPNIAAMMLGRTPFSTQHVCGRYVGGWHDREIAESADLPANHPTFSGVNGHVRVMTRGQLRILLKQAGFVIQREWSFAFGHYILFHCHRW